MGFVFPTYVYTTKKLLMIKYVTQVRDLHFKNVFDMCS
jgi:hypothetical protein